MTAPDLFEPFIGWKGLRADAAGDLWSPQLPVRWPVGKALVAKCNVKKGHKPPVWNCGCGVYAVKTFEDLKKHGYHWGEQTEDGKVWVLAEIALWGESEGRGVIKAQIGYKAQKAAVQTIYVPATMLSLGRLIYDRYGVGLGMIDRFTGKRKLLARRNT